MRDGLASGEFKVGSLIAGVGSVTGSTEVESGGIGVEEQGFVGTGSPPTYYATVLYGAVTIPAATSVWEVFGQKFGATPSLVLTDGVADVTFTDLSAGSFLASGTEASVGYYVAIGSV